MSDWLDALAALRREREAAVLVTVAAARGHAPREAGATSRGYRGTPRNFCDAAAL